MKHASHTESAQEHRSLVANQFNEPQGAQMAFADNRDSAIAQRYLADSMQQSQQINNQQQTVSQVNSSPLVVMQRKQLAEGFGEAVQRQEELEDEELLQGKFEIAQRQEPEEEELLQGKFDTVQRQELEEDEEPLQGKFSNSESPIQLQEETKQSENRTGMPDQLKGGMESLSGMDMSDVRVHYNSSKPAQLNALAYAQGKDIHLGAGQEQHLPHEAWHVVQQRQGRVRPTVQVKGVGVNDDVGLEMEADLMGGEALQAKVGLGGEEVKGAAPLKRQSNQGMAVADRGVQKQRGHESNLQFSDNQPETTTKRTLQAIMNQNSVSYIQRKENSNEEGLSQLKVEPAQRLERTAGVSRGPVLVVDDSVTELSSHQLTKTDFLTRLKQAIYEVGTEEYEGTNLTVDGCLYIAYWFAHYLGEESRVIERAARKYSSASPSVESAYELIDLICKRARKGFSKQVVTGAITELPEDIPEEVGRDATPEPELIIQGKLFGAAHSQKGLIHAPYIGAAMDNGIGFNVIQRGCLSGGGQHEESEEDKFLKKVAVWKSTPAPSGFTLDDMLFASIDNEKVGSIYFTGGRVRLVHPEAGPAVEPVDPSDVRRIHVIDGEFWRLKREFKSEKKSFKVLYDESLSNGWIQDVQIGSGIPLVEILIKVSNTHSSGGCPGIIPNKDDLTEEHINLLYHVANEFKGDNNGFRKAMDSDEVLTNIKTREG